MHICVCFRTIFLCLFRRNNQLHDEFWLSGGSLWRCILAHLPIHRPLGFYITHKYPLPLVINILRIVYNHCDIWNNASGKCLQTVGLFWLLLLIMPYVLQHIYRKKQKPFYHEYLISNSIQIAWNSEALTYIIISDILSVILEDKTCRVLTWCMSLSDNMHLDQNISCKNL